MDNLTNHMLLIDYEILRRDGVAYPSPKPPAMVKPPLLGRAMTALGEVMIRVGSRLKAHSYHSLTPEKASDPTFLIML